MIVRLSRIDNKHYIHLDQRLHRFPLVDIELLMDPHYYPCHWFLMQLKVYLVRTGRSPYSIFYMKLWNLSKERKTKSVCDGMRRGRGFLSNEFMPSVLVLVE